MNKYLSEIKDNTFAAACFNQNSISELQAAVNEKADQIDMKTWGITANEWRSQIELALNAKLAELEDEE